MKGMKPKPLPGEVFVRRDGEGTQDEILLADESIGDAAEKDEVVRVGRYRLVEELDVSTTIMTTIVKRRKRAS